MSGDNFLSEMINENSSVCGIKKLTTMYKTFDNYYDHKKYAEYVPIAIVMFLLSNLMLFDDITVINGGFIKSIPDIIFIGYSVLYYNINSWLGRSMTKFLLLLRFTSVILSFILPYYKIISLIDYVLSGLFLTVGYHKLTNKSYGQLVELKYHNIYLAPFYAYTFYEKNYDLEQNIYKLIDIIVNYIKKFSTSDIIKQYDSGNQFINTEDEVTDNIIDDPTEELQEETIEETIEEMNNNEEEGITSDVNDNKESESQSTKLKDEYEGIQTRSKTNKKDD
tara:strand:+ start:1347 stop:2183 length:837 start_codon:yes stop_codon:yes gene_type:complete